MQGKACTKAAHGAVSREAQEQREESIRGNRKIMVRLGRKYVWGQGTGLNTGTLVDSKVGFVKLFRTLG